MILGEKSANHCQDVLDLLGNGLAVQGLIFKYFATTHKWMPIVAKQRLTRNMANPIWQAGSDLALLFLCMKLITSRPQDNIESTQNPLYLSAKRFLALMEASGTISLIVLQAGLLIVWYEYGQAIYPRSSLDIWLVFEIWKSFGNQWSRVCNQFTWSSCKLPSDFNLPSY